MLLHTHKKSVASVPLTYQIDVAMCSLCAHLQEVFLYCLFFICMKTFLHYSGSGGKKKIPKHKL